jgi:hypothetical protein
MLGRKCVGRVTKRDDTYVGVVGAISVTAPTKEEAFRAVVDAVGGTTDRERRVTGDRASRPRMWTHETAEQALGVLIADYEAGLPPTTYTELLERIGLDRRYGRDCAHAMRLIDAACASVGVAPFALARVRDQSRAINRKAWSRTKLRDAMIARAENGAWSDDAFDRIRSALASFEARGLGQQKGGRMSPTSGADSAASRRGRPSHRGADTNLRYTFAGVCNSR